MPDLSPPTAWRPRSRTTAEGLTRARSAPAPRAPLGFRQRLAGLIAGKGHDVVQRSREAVPEHDAIISYLIDNPVWRPLSERGPRDLQPQSHDDLLKICFGLSRRNTAFKRCTALGVHFVIGSGMRVHADHETVDSVLTDFWESNRMERRTRAWAWDLSVLGEWLKPAFVQPTGIVKLTTLDPLQVHHVRTNPYDIEEPVEVVLRDPRTGLEGERVTVIRRDVLSPEGGFMTDPGTNLVTPAGLFLHQVNKPTGATRGFPDYADGVDWFDAEETVLFHGIERAAIVNALVWDVTLTGASREQVLSYAAEQESKGPLHPGATRVHDENVKWEAIAPDFGAGEHETIQKLVRQKIGTCTGYPEHWLFEGGDVNRATASEMNSGPLRMLQERQSVIVEALEEMVDFQLWIGKRAGFFAGLAPEDFHYEIEVQPIVEATVEERLTNLTSLQNVLAFATQRLALDPEDEGRLIRAGLREAGFDVQEPGADGDRRASSQRGVVVLEDVRRQMEAELRAAAEDERRAAASRAAA